MRFLWLALMAATNAFDATATAHLVKLGIAEERNPVMKYFLDMGEWPFFFVKCAMVGVGCGIMLYLWDRSKVVKWAAPAVLSAYVFVCLYHLHAIIQL